MPSMHMVISLDTITFTVHLNLDQCCHRPATIMDLPEQTNHL